MAIVDALRDALILYFLTFSVGAVFAFSGGNGLPGHDYILYALEAVLIFAGFFIAGAHTEIRRYRAAGMRGFFLWLLGAANFTVGIAFSSWLLSGVLIAGLLFAAEASLLAMGREKKNLFAHCGYHRIRPILGDALAIYFTTVAAGFVVGLSGLKDPAYLLAFLSPAILFFGFFCSGFCARPSRFFYMASVATIVWLLGGVTIIPAAGLSAWIFGGVVTYGMLLASWAALRGLKFCRRAGA